MIESERKRRRTYRRMDSRSVPLRPTSWSSCTPSWSRNWIPSDPYWAWAASAWWRRSGFRCSKSRDPRTFRTRGHQRPAVGPPKSAAIRPGSPPPWTTRISPGWSCRTSTEIASTVTSIKLPTTLRSFRNLSVFREVGTSWNLSCFL